MSGYKNALEEIYSESFLSKLLKEEEIADRVGNVAYTEKVRSLEQSKHNWKRIAIVATTTSTIVGLIFILNIVLQNISVLNRQLLSLRTFIQQVASNNVANLIVGILGLLPLLFSVLVWSAKKLVGILGPNKNPS